MAKKRISGKTASQSRVSKGELEKSGRSASKKRPVGKTSRTAGVSRKKATGNRSAATSRSTPRARPSVIVGASASTKQSPTKTASLVFHYMGDSKFILFFQETMKLKHAMEGYDKVVLLKFNELDPWLDLSEGDERLADTIATPTKANLRRQLKQLARDGYMIDIWIVGHGSRGGFNISKGRYGSDETMRSAEIRDLAKLAGKSELPIRMVWSTLCHGETLNSAWREVGAKVIAGSANIYFYPTTFTRFAKEWNKGSSYSAALRASNTSATRTLVQAGMIAHSKTCLKKWGGKIWQLNVLGKGNAAKKYFTSMWLSDSAWDDSKSGKQNMNASSKKIIAGSGRISKRSQPSWNH